MRRFEFTTLIDPLEARFGKRWAAVLFLPALAGELFWSAELLVAIGSTFGVLLGMPLTTAILLSAVVTTAYTVLGGMWSVAYTDIFQLGLVALGLARRAAVRRSTARVACRTPGRTYAAARPEAVGLMPPIRPHTDLWTRGSVVGWWDVSLMLIFGGIPWNCYFQRVLSCRTPRDAQAPVDSGRRADDRVHRSAAADGDCRLRVSVASRYRVPTPGDACGRDAAAVRDERCRAPSAFSGSRRSSAP